MDLSCVFLLDPHVTDEVYTPIRYFIKKRRGLRKYSFFSELCRSSSGVNIIFSSMVSGLLPHKHYSKLPRIIKFFVSIVESKLWSLLNSITINSNYPKTEDIVVVFLRNMTKEINSEIYKLRKEGVRIVWVTSHFHLSYGNKSFVSNKDHVLIDNKLPNSITFNAKNLILPPNVNERFKVLDINNKRLDKILCVGTIHMYRNKFEGSIKYKEIYTMHPSRADIFFSNNPILQKNFSIVSDDDSLYYVQRSYMETDLASMYNNFRFAFIGSEAIGIAALGSFEAMACGCEIFIEKDVGHRLGLVDGINAWFFSGDHSSLEARVELIIDSSMKLDKRAMREFLESYSTHTLISKFKKHFNLYI